VLAAIKTPKELLKLNSSIKSQFYLMQEAKPLWQWHVHVHGYY
jgi:hypothetical protein